MRFLIAILLALGVTAFATVEPTISAESGYVFAAAQQPSGQIDVDVSTDGAAWWTSPVWIGIGIVTLIALIAIIAAVSRGGTTVVKD